MRVRCTKCGKKQDSGSFYGNGKGGKRSDCKRCHRKTMRPRSLAHYRANRNYYRERNRKRSAEIIAYIRAYKAGKSCMDCGKPYPFWILDFDHRIGADKDEMLSRVYRRGWSLARVQREIDKCDLVCANCHRDRTYKRATERRRCDSNAHP